MARMEMLTEEQVAMLRRRASDPRAKAWRDLPWKLRYAEMPPVFLRAMRARTSKVDAETIAKVARGCWHHARKARALVDALSDPQIEVVLDGRRITRAKVTD